MKLLRFMGKVVYLCAKIAKTGAKAFFLTETCDMICVDDIVCLRLVPAAHFCYNKINK